MTRRGLAITTVLGTLVTLALAICPGRGITRFFANPARSALVAAVVLLTITALFTQGNVSAGIIEDRKNRWVLWIFGIIGLLLIAMPAYADRKNFWIVGGETMRWIGVLLFLGGGALRLWPVFVLGRNFSGLVAIQPGHVLVTTGPYRFIRHPSYLGLVISSLGWALAFRSGVGIVLTLCLLPPLIARIHAEEKLLRDYFDTAYEAYSARTSRLIPGIY